MRTTTCRRKLCFLTNPVFILTALTILGANSDVQFQYDSEQCLDQLVEYQCTLTGSGYLSLTWRVLDNNGTQVGGAVSYISSTPGSDGSIGGGVFTVEQLSTSPLVSNISFTVQSSIDGYTIICEDSVTMNNENFTIDIKGPPSQPNNIVLHYICDQVNISWNQPSSQCVTSYNVTGNFSDDSISTTDTSVMPSNQLSPNIYCVQVLAIDTANRPGNYSKKKCEILSEIPLPTISNNKWGIDTCKVKWTSHLQCYNLAYFNVTYNFNNGSVTTTDTSIDLPLDGLSAGIYSVSVAAVDTANRTGPFSDDSSINLDDIKLPLPPLLTWDSDSCIITWNSPTLHSQCLSVAYYIVEFNFNDSSINSNTNTAYIPLYGERSDNNFCTQVTAVDTAFRNSSTNQSCINLKKDIKPPPKTTQLNLGISCHQVNIGWILHELPSPCVPIAHYNVTHNFSSNAFIEIADTTASVQLDEVYNSDSRYCVSVAAVDIVNRKGEDTMNCTFLPAPKCLDSCTVNVNESSREGKTYYTLEWNITSDVLSLESINILYSINGMTMNETIVNIRKAIHTIEEGGTDHQKYEFNVTAYNCIGIATTCPCVLSNTRSGLNFQLTALIIIIIGVLIILIALGGLIVIITYYRKKINRCLSSKVKASPQPPIANAIELRVNNSTDPTNKEEDNIKNTVNNSEYSQLWRRDEEREKMGNDKPDVIPSGHENGVASEYSTLKTETYADLAQTRTKANNTIGVPPQSSERVDYAALKHKVEYADVSICQKGQEGHVNSRLPQQPVMYSSVMQWQQQHLSVTAGTIEYSTAKE